MKPTTRLRILDYLRTHQTATVREMGRALSITGANVRHHLAVLESTDVIELVNQRREGRGRPVNVYGLSRRMLGDSLDELSGALLNVWLGQGTDEKWEAGLRSVARRLAGEDAPAPGIAFPRRLALAVDRLNQLHYQARWEAGAAGPRLLLGHCPYSAIIADHPELCRMDAFLLETQLGLPVEQTAKLQPSAKGLPFCAFVVGGNQSGLPN